MKRFLEWLSKSPEQRFLESISDLMESETLPTDPVTARQWKDNAIGVGAKYLVIVHIHNPFDPPDMDELWPRVAHSWRHLRRIVATYDRVMDGTVTQILDLTRGSETKAVVY